MNHLGDPGTVVLEYDLLHRVHGSLVGVWLLHRNQLRISSPVPHCLSGVCPRTTAGSDPKSVVLGLISMPSSNCVRGSGSKRAVVGVGDDRAVV